MGVYLWNNVYEYSYDFRNKTASNLISDWWTFTTWQSQFTSDSNWCWRNSTSSDTRAKIELGNKFANAKKITVTTNIYVNKVATWDSITFAIYTTSWSNGTWLYMWGIAWNWASWYVLTYPERTTSIQSQTFSTGALTFVSTYDLENLTCTMTNSKGYPTQTGTITTTARDNIRANDYLWIIFYAWASTPVYKLTSGTIVVEY